MRVYQSRKSVFTVVLNLCFSSFYDNMYEYFMLRILLRLKCTQVVPKLQGYHTSVISVKGPFINDSIPA